MNSTLKPLSRSPSITSGQLNKQPMHPQGAPASYGQSASHGVTSMINMHPNTTVAHSHSPQNPYSLNVPNVAGHYLNPVLNQNIMAQIPASNHPIANSSTNTPGQVYGPQKSNASAGNLGDPQTQDTVSSETGNTGATQVQQTQQQHQGNISVCVERPQSNRTSETKFSSHKVETTTSTHLLVKEISAVSSQSESQNSPSHHQSPQANMTSEKLKSVQNEETPVKLLNPSLVSDTPKTIASTPSTLSCESNSSSPEKPVCIKVENTNKFTDEPKIDAKKGEKNKNEQSSNASANSNKQEVESKLNLPENPSESKPVDVFSNKETSLKLAVTSKSPLRKARTSKLEEPFRSSKETKNTTMQKSPSIGKTRRHRTRTQPYQSPLPELEIISKISTPPRNKNNDDKLIVFYKNEHLAVRNAEGGFYLCQAVQNVYKTSSKIKIRWLSQDKTDKSGEIYTPDFYDQTDFDCILTNLSLGRIGRGKYKLPLAEKKRTESILNRSLAVEKGEVSSSSLTEEHPDGLDLSLYKDEEQLKKRKGTKRKSNMASHRSPSKKQKSNEKISAPIKVNKNTASKGLKKKEKNATSTKDIAVSVETKKVGSTRSNKEKRKDNIKKNPVVDQKKAKVLAKIGRNAAMPKPKVKTETTSKSSKASKGGGASAKKSTPKLPLTKAPPSRSSRRLTCK